MKEDHKDSSVTSELLQDLEQFLKENFVPEGKFRKSSEERPTKSRPRAPEPGRMESRKQRESPVWKSSGPEEGLPSDESISDFDLQSLEMYEDTLDLRLEEPFSVRLLQLIDEKGYTDSEVYKRAHIDRKLFSKIRSNEDYIPRKKNVIALSLALRLNLDEANDLLRRAGMALSHSSRADLIAEYCISHEIYDINTVNELLYDHGEPPLG